MNRRQEIVAWATGLLCLAGLHRDLRWWNREYVPFVLVLGLVLFGALRTREPASDRTALGVYGVAAMAVVFFWGAQRVAYAMPDTTGFENALLSIATSLDGIATSMPTR